MSDHDIRIVLMQMLDHAREVTQMTEGRSRSDLDSDRMFNLAVVRLLEIIGEAANRVPKEIQLNYNNIPLLEFPNVD